MEGSFDYITQVLDRAVEDAQSVEVKERMKTLLSEFPSVAFADVVEDPHLAGTACVVETDAGSVEASIDGQLAAIEKSIRKNFAKDRST